MAAPCAIPGCPQDARQGRARCPDHDKARRRSQDAKRPNSSARGYDHRWSKFRKRFLRDNPHCQCSGCPACRTYSGGDRCIRPASEPDHLDGQGPLGPRGYDRDNLQSLCKSCHSSKTVRHDGGFGVS